MKNLKLSALAATLALAYGTAFAADSTSTISQSGDGNNATTTQTFANASSASVSQTGDNNAAGVTQGSSENAVNGATASVTQNGNGHVATIDQQHRNSRSIPFRQFFQFSNGLKQPSAPKTVRL